MFKIFSVVLFSLLFIGSLNASWSLDRINQRYLPLDGNEQIVGTGNGVTVYVVDSGVILNLAEFEGRVSKGYGQNSVNCDGHGTAVAAIIGSHTYGVAKKSQLVSVQVRCTGNATPADVVKGLKWILRDCRKGGCVVNISMGGASYSTALNDAVQNLIDVGITVVVAAGNTGGDACLYSPSAVSGAIVVGGSRQDDTVLPYSNYGSCVDIFAPGEGVWTIWNRGEQTYFSGTSAASPHVAGLAALYLETHPNATPAQVQAVIVGNATPGVINGAVPNLFIYTGF